MKSVARFTLTLKRTLTPARREAPKRLTAQPTILSERLMTTVTRAVEFPRATGKPSIKTFAASHSCSWLAARYYSHLSCGAGGRHLILPQPAQRFSDTGSRAFTNLRLSQVPRHRQHLLPRRHRITVPRLPTPRTCRIAPPPARTPGTSPHRSPTQSDDGARAPGTRSETGSETPGKSDTVSPAGPGSTSSGAGDTAAPASTSGAGAPAVSAT